MITLDELLIVSRTVWQEARGEPDEGKRAIVHVLHNRAKAQDTDMAYEALRPKQFSGWNAGESSRRAARDITLANPAFRRAIRTTLEAIEAIVAGKDPTEGSRHYHADYVKPYWARGKKPVIVIGRHLFYNDVR